MMLFTTIILSITILFVNITLFKILIFDASVFGKGNLVLKVQNLGLIHNLKHFRARQKNVRIASSKLKRANFHSYAVKGYLQQMSNSKKKKKDFICF